MEKIPFKQIFITTIIAVILTLINFGDFFNQIVPFWILLFFSYFLINYNMRYEFFIALILGLIIDMSSSNITGQTSFALIITSYFILYNKPSIKIANQTTIIVFIAIASFIYLASILTIHIIIQGFDLSYYIFLSPLTTAIFYPPIEFLLKKC